MIIRTIPKIAMASWEPGISIQLKTTRPIPQINDIIPQTTSNLCIIILYFLGDILFMESGESIHYNLFTIIYVESR